MGGRKKVLADLTDMFERTPKNYFWNQYYNHANEPVHHVPFLFNRLGAPSLPRNGHGIFVGMLIRMQYWDW